MRFYNENPQVLCLLEKLEQQEAVIKQLRSENETLTKEIKESNRLADWYKGLYNKVIEVKKGSIEMYNSLAEQVLHFELAGWFEKLFFKFKV